MSEWYCDNCYEIPLHQKKNKGNDDRKGKNQKYDTNYLQLSFHAIGDESEPKLFCVICNEILANSSLKPWLLHRRTEKKNHPTHKDKPLEYFKRKLADIKRCSLSFFLTSNKDSKMALEASFRVTYRIARSRKAHTVEENFIGPCAKDIGKRMLGEKSVA